MRMPVTKNDKCVIKPTRVRSSFLSAHALYKITFSVIVALNDGSLRCGKYLINVSRCVTVWSCLFLL